VQFEIETKRVNSNHPVQPYLVGVGDKKKILTYILVLGDSQSIQLPRNCLGLRALDLLIKAHYALNIEFVLGWKNVYRFLTLHVYKLPPTKEQIEKRHSTFVEQFMQLKNL